MTMHQCFAPCKGAISVTSGATGGKTGNPFPSGNPARVQQNKSQIKFKPCRLVEEINGSLLIRRFGFTTGGY